MKLSAKIAIGTVAVLAAMPVLAVVARRELEGRAEANLDRELASARKDGIPVTDDELNALLKVPDQDNAAPIYAKVDDLLKRDARAKADLDLLHDASRTFPLGGSPFSADASDPFGSASKRQKPDPAGALLRLRPVLDLAREAAKYPHWSIPWKRSVGGYSIGEKTVIDLAIALASEAEALTTHGDWVRSLADLKAIQRLATHLGDVSTFEALDQQRIAERAWQRGLAKLIRAHGRDSKFVRAALAMQDRFGPLPNLHHALCCELIGWRRVVPELKSKQDWAYFECDDDECYDKDNTPTLYDKLTVGSRMTQLNVDASLVAEFRRMIASVPADPDKWPEAERGMAAVKASLDAHPTFANRLARQAFKYLSDPTNDVRSIQNYRRLTTVALRLCAERNANGAFPEHLPNYGDLTQDPFGAGPLHYHRKGPGFVLFSVGSNGKEDGTHPTSSNVIEVD